jgi:hypothetical protein
MQKFNTPQAEATWSAKIDPDNVTIDVASPRLGFLLGVQLIARTMGSVLLWDNCQGGVDARVAVVAARSRSPTA